MTIAIMINLRSYVTRVLNWLDANPVLYGAGLQRCNIGVWQRVLAKDLK